MNIFEKLTRFVRRVFKTSLEVFLEALKHSPNAQGYVSGSITELLLKKKLESEYGLEIKRIREKWEGRKHSRHHGDFYFSRRDTKCWYVMESKGVKSKPALQLRETQEFPCRPRRQNPVDQSTQGC